jgi:hypothetical protein
MYSGKIAVPPGGGGIVSLESMIKDVTDRIETIKYKLMQEDNSEEKVNRMSFLTEQFSLIFKEQNRLFDFYAIKKMLRNAEIE